MKLLLLLIIKTYWKLIPPAKRNKCLFKESCSKHVYNTAQQKGLVAGLKALIHRVKNCRSGYSVIDIEDDTFVLSANNELFRIDEMRDTIFN